MIVRHQNFAVRNDNTIPRCGSASDINTCRAVILRNAMRHRTRPGFRHVAENAARQPCRGHARPILLRHSEDFFGWNRGALAVAAKRVAADRCDRSTSPRRLSIQGAGSSTVPPHARQLRQLAAIVLDPPVSLRTAAGTAAHGVPGLWPTSHGRLPAPAASPVPQGRPAAAKAGASSQLAGSPLRRALDIRRLVQRSQ